jgi:hypothetical protein
MRFVPPRLLSSLLVVAALLPARAALADVEDEGANYNPGKAKRRSDFALGFSLSGMAGAVSGYPLDANKMNVERYRATSGAAGGTGGGLWVGGALRDWFVVGVGLNFGSIAGGDATLSRGGAFVFHLEGFPLFPVGGAFRDLAVVGEFGTGNRKLIKASQTVADGGMMSYASAGILYEPIRIGSHVSAGPMLLLAYQFSETLNAAFAIAGVQIAYYGGPD